MFPPGDLTPWPDPGRFYIKCWPKVFGKSLTQPLDPMATSDVWETLLSMGIKIDSMTDAQVKYAGVWEHGA